MTDEVRGLKREPSNEIMIVDDPCQPTSEAEREAVMDHWLSIQDRFGPDLLPHRGARNMIRRVDTQAR